MRTAVPRQFYKEARPDGPVGQTVEKEIIQILLYCRVKHVINRNCRVLFHIGSLGAAVQTHNGSSVMIAVECGLSQRHWNRGTQPAAISLACLWPCLS